MTIQELYDWAKENDVTDCDLIVRDFTGANTYQVEPEKVINGDSFEVLL